MPTFMEQMLESIGQGIQEQVGGVIQRELSERAGGGLGELIAKGAWGIGFIQGREAAQAEQLRRLQMERMQIENQYLGERLATELALMRMQLLQAQDQWLHFRRMMPLEEQLKQYELEETKMRLENLKKLAPLQEQQVTLELEKLRNEVEAGRWTLQEYQEKRQLAEKARGLFPKISDNLGKIVVLSTSLKDAIGVGDHPTVNKLRQELEKTLQEFHTNIGELYGIATQLGDTALSNILTGFVQLTHGYAYEIFNPRNQALTYMAAFTQTPEFQATYTRRKRELIEQKVQRGEPPTITEEEDYDLRQQALMEVIPRFMFTKPEYIFGLSISFLIQQAISNPEALPSALNALATVTRGVGNFVIDKEKNAIALKKILLEHNIDTRKLDLQENIFKFKQYIETAKLQEVARHHRATEAIQIERSRLAAFNRAISSGDTSVKDTLQMALALVRAYFGNRLGELSPEARGHLSSAIANFVSAVQQDKSKNYKQIQQAIMSGNYAEALRLINEGGWTANMMLAFENLLDAIDSIQMPPRGAGLQYRPDMIWEGWMQHSGLPLYGTYGTLPSTPPVPQPQPQPQPQPPQIVVIPSSGGGMQLPQSMPLYPMPVPQQPQTVPSPQPQQPQVSTVFMVRKGNPEQFRGYVLVDAQRNIHMLKPAPGQKLTPDAIRQTPLYQQGGVAIGEVYELGIEPGGKTVRVGIYIPPEEKRRWEIKPTTQGAALTTPPAPSLPPLSEVKQLPQTPQGLRQQFEAQWVVGALQLPQSRIASFLGMTSPLREIYSLIRPISWIKRDVEDKEPKRIEAILQQAKTRNPIFGWLQRVRFTQGDHLKDALTGVVYETAPTTSGFGMPIKKQSYTIFRDIANMMEFLLSNNIVRDDDYIEFHDIPNKPLRISFHRVPSTKSGHIFWHIHVSRPNDKYKILYIYSQSGRRVVEYQVIPKQRGEQKWEVPLRTLPTSPKSTRR